MLKFKWNKYHPLKDGIESQAFNNVRLIIFPDESYIPDINVWFHKSNRSEFIEHPNDELEIIEDYGYEYQSCLH